MKRYWAKTVLEGGAPTDLAPLCAAWAPRPWDRAETNAIIGALCCSLVAAAYGAWRGANCPRRPGAVKRH
jgi:hypothetical protein